MQTCDTLLHAGVLLTQDDDRRVLENAALAIVQINDLGQGLERITVWPKASRRAGYTPVFPMPQK